MSPTLDEIAVADPPEAWAAVGFEVCDGVIDVGAVRFGPAGREAGRGVFAVTARELEDEHPDGLPLSLSQSPPREPRAEPTPAGAPRQAFFRLAEVILEVVQAPPGSREERDADAPARFWGLAFGVADLAATAEALGDKLGEPRDAVQEGRRLATLRREAGLSPGIAFMS